jgi:hemolysin activation/secretion protein
MHQQWDPATELALLGQSEVPGLYRERFSAEPAIVILITPGLSLTTGLSFEHFQTQFPAARYEAANSVLTTLRHRRSWGSRSSRAGQELDAGYSLRAATNLLDSDFVYARHAADVRYSLQHEHSTLVLRGGVGSISGRAPLFERFAIGDTKTLRGWNKFDVDPLGGSRVAYGSVEYRYRFIGVFYDTGAVWDKQEEPETKHSAGIILAASRGGAYLTVGFPLRGGSIYPLFMMGMNF